MNHKKILARVCARNARKEAVVETNEPRWPYFIVMPQNPRGDVPDYFTADFRQPEEKVLPVGTQTPVGITIEKWFYNKSQALNYLR